MYTVELEKVRKTFDRTIAVDDLSLQIPPGRIFGLLGPNGAGKTSTIRMMIGMMMPDSGVVNMFGSPFQRKALARVGYLPEERGLYKKMKVQEQLALFGQLHGLSAQESNTRARKWAERFEIDGWLGKKADELSKGMQQKIQFIATLLHDPDFVIMDEPFSGLDPVNSTLLKDALMEMKEAGKTILFSSHRMDQVEKLCDSICLVNHGRAVLQGDLKSIKASYGKNHVQIEYEGKADVLDDKSLVASYNDYGNYVEARLAPGADAQKLLHQALTGARINRFELMEPSLEEIFIDVVGGKADA